MGLEICSVASLLPSGAHSHRWKIPSPVRKEVWPGTAGQRSGAKSREEVYLILLSSVECDGFYSLMGRSTEGGTEEWKTFLPCLGAEKLAEWEGPWVIRAHRAAEDSWKQRAGSVLGDISKEDQKRAGLGPLLCG